MPLRCATCKRAHDKLRKRRGGAGAVSGVSQVVATPQAAPAALRASLWAASGGFAFPESVSRQPWAAPRYIEDLLDVFCLPLATGPRVVVVQKSAQVGYTSALLAALVRFLVVDQYRASIYMPNDKAAASFSKDTLAPVIESNPPLKRLADAVQDKRQLSLALKVLGRAVLRCLGAVSPAQFRRFAAEVVLLDELDGYPADIGNEGDAVALSGRATRNQRGRVICGSTPTLEGESQVERQVERSSLVFDYAVRCPCCGAFDLLEWERMTWAEQGDPATRAATVRHACASCGGEWDYSALPGALAGGRWQSEGGEWIDPGGVLRGAPSWPRQVAFRIWSGYSPWWSWSDMVLEWLMAQGDPAAQKSFTTLALGRPWREADVFVEEGHLMQGAENLAVLPSAAVLGILAVDVQDGWLSCMVVAFGEGEEAWIVERREFHGGVDTADAPAWLACRDWLETRPTWPRESGDPLRLDLTVLDTGYQADTCYQSALAWPGRCMAIKGYAGWSRPVVKVPPTKIRTRQGRVVPLHNVGVDVGKVTVVGRLAAGRIHLADTLPPAVFGELSAERLVTKRERGRDRKRWVQTRDRNEGIDEAVYALAACRLVNPTWAALAARKGTVQAPRRASPKTTPKPAPKTPKDPMLDRVRRARRRGFR